MKYIFFSESLSLYIFISDTSLVGGEMLSAAEGGEGASAAFWLCTPQCTS